MASCHEIDPIEIINNIMCEAMPRAWLRSFNRGLVEPNTPFLLPNLKKNPKNTCLIKMY